MKLKPADILNCCNNIKRKVLKRRPILEEEMLSEGKLAERLQKFGSIV